MRSRTQGDDRRAVPWVARVGLLLLSTALSLAGAEIVVRAGGWAPQIHAIEITGGAYRTTEDPRLPYAPVPGKGQFNRQGVRDRDRSTAARAGSPRVVAIGDSILFGGGSPVEKIFTSRLEDILRAGDPRLRDTEVWNFGVPGYDTVNEVALLERRGLLLEPHLVIVGYCLNDMFTASSELRELAKHPKHREQSRLRALMARTAVAKSELVRLVLFRLQPDALDASGPRVPDPPYANVQRGFDRLAQLSQTHEFDVVVVIFPFLEPFTTYAHERQHTTVARMARARGFGVFDLLPSFRAMFREDSARLRVHPHDRLHLNAEAHQFAAQRVAPLISTRLLARPQTP